MQIITLRLIIVSQVRSLKERNNIYTILCFSEKEGGDGEMFDRRQVTGEGERS